MHDFSRPLIHLRIRGQLSPEVDRSSSVRNMHFRAADSCISPPNLQIDVSVHFDVHRNGEQRGVVVHKPVEFAVKERPPHVVHLD